MRLEAARAVGALSRGVPSAADARAAQAAALLQRACSAMALHGAPRGCADAWSGSADSAQHPAQHAAGCEVPLSAESVSALMQRLLFDEPEEGVQVRCGDFARQDRLPAVPVAVFVMQRHDINSTSSFCVLLPRSRR